MTRRLRGDRGATAVEFALLVPVVLVLVGGLLVLGLRTIYSASTAFVAQEGLRTVAVPTGTGPRVVTVDSVCAAAATAVPDAIEPASRCTPGADFTLDVCSPTCAGPVVRGVGEEVEVVEGMPLQVRVRWRVGALVAASDLALGTLDATALVSRSSTGRAE